MVVDKISFIFKRIKYTMARNNKNYCNQVSTASIINSDIFHYLHSFSPFETIKLISETGESIH